MSEKHVIINITWQFPINQKATRYITPLIATNQKRTAAASVLLHYFNCV